MNRSLVWNGLEPFLYSFLSHSLSFPPVTQWGGSLLGKCKSLNRKIKEDLYFLCKWMCNPHHASFGWEVGTRLKTLRTYGDPERMYCIRRGCFFKFLLSVDEICEMNATLRWDGCSWNQLWVRKNEASYVWQPFWLSPSSGAWSHISVTSRLLKK